MFTFIKEHLYGNLYILTNPKLRHKEHIMGQNREQNNTQAWFIGYDMRAHT